MLHVLMVMPPRLARSVVADLQGAGRRLHAQRLGAAAELTTERAASAHVLLVEAGSLAAEVARHVAARELELPCIGVSEGEPDAEALLAAVQGGLCDLVPTGATARLLAAIDKGLREAGLRRRCRQAEQALARSEQRFALFMQHLPGVAFLKDEAGRYVWGNAFLCRAAGVGADEIAGKTDLDLWPPHVAAGFQDSDRGALAADGAIEETGTLGHDGELWDHYTVRFPLYEPDGRRLVAGIGIDISERCRAERQLQQAAAALERRAGELRALASEMTQVEQRERRRLAQLLHDHLQQLLVGARYDLRALRRRAQDGEVRRALEAIEELLRESLEASRCLTMELSPPILYEAGLGAALHWLARWMEQKHGLVVDVSTDGVVIKDESIRVLLFQAARELLFNVVKHADVERARARLWREESRVRLSIEDKGNGFDPEALSPSADGGFGLFSVRERLGFFGGRVQVVSRCGAGARVVLDAPLEPTSAAEPTGRRVPEAPATVGSG